MQTMYPNEINEIDASAKLIKSINNRPRSFFIKGNLVMAAFLAIAIYFNTFIVLAAVFMILGNLIVLIAPNHKVADIYEDFLVVYSSDDQTKCRIIRYEEIIQWKLGNDENGTVEIITGTEANPVSFSFETANDTELFEELMKVIGEKNESKKQMNTMLEQRQDEISLPMIIRYKFKKMFKKK